MNIRVTKQGLRACSVKDGLRGIKSLSIQNSIFFNPLLTEQGKWWFNILELSQFVIIEPTGKKKINDAKTNGGTDTPELR
jgi:GTP-dependent phosphoenolpyruvate carboxykinase